MYTRHVIVATSLLGLLTAPALAAPPPPPAEEAPAPEVPALAIEPTAEPALEGTAAADAPAEEEAGPIYVHGGLFGTGLTAALKVGGSFSQAFSELGAAFTPEVELGVTLPFAERMLEVFFSGQWAAPTLDGTAGPDERLPGDQMMTYSVTQQELALTLGLRLRIPIESRLFRPHVSLGARAYLLRTEVSGAGGGEPFGANEETDTRFGFLGAIGGELFVGPGALTLELQIGYATVDGFILRDTNVGALNALLGYRFFF